jgi:hypothetical protein
VPAPTHTDPNRPPLDQRLADAVIALEEQINEGDFWGMDPQIFLWQPPVMAALAVDSSEWRKADGHPSAILPRIADQWDDIKASLIAQDPIVFGQPPQGVVLLSEAWSLNIGAATARGEHAKVAEYRRAAANRVIYKHPDRQELRSVAAVDRHLNVLHLVRWRGEGTALTDSSDGLIPDTMKEFITRVTAPSPL